MTQHRFAATIVVALMLAVLLTGCDDAHDIDFGNTATHDGNVNDGGGAGGDSDGDQTPGMMAGVEPVVTIRGRLEPVQGRSAIIDPPLRHGDPAANEGDFVDRSDSMTVSQFADLGEFEMGDPSPRIERSELVAGEHLDPPANPARVFYLLHMADIQVVDEESPGLIPASKFAVPTVTAAAYRPQNPYIIHNAEAMVQAAEKLQQETADYDLAVHTGDAVENAQRNELGWFLSLLDGGRIEPDTGIREDLIAGPDNDPQDPFDAPGLNAPWLSTIGNHDLEAIGNLPPILVQFINNPVRFAFIQQAFGAQGLSIPNVPTADERRDRLSQRQLLLRNGDDFAGLNAPVTLDALLSRTELTTAFDGYFNGGNLQPQAVGADGGRAALDTCAFVNAHLEASGQPPGHGFTRGFNGEDDNGECSGDYSYTPPDAPWLRVISLATGNPFGGDEGVVGRAQMPPDPQALAANDGIDEDTSDAFSSTNGILQNQPLRRPNTSRRLFNIPAFQGLAQPDANGDPRRDSIAFLDTQLQAALDNEQLAIVISHHRSSDLTASADLRVFLEASICQAVAAAAVLVSADCDPSDGTMSTGDVGMPVNSRNAAGNIQALDFFAKLITQRQTATYDNLTQLGVATGATILNAAQPGASDQLADGFEILFALRALMPDPVDALTPAQFRQKLADNPNVILHLAGHEHKLRVAAVCSDATVIDADDPADDASDARTCNSVGANPGAGYYEIVTAGSLELSKEWRLDELVDNNNGTLTVYGSTFGARGGRLNDAGIKLAFADALTGGLDITPDNGIDNHQDSPGDVNVKLTIPIPAAIDARLDSAATRSGTILTTSAPILQPASDSAP